MAELDPTSLPHHPAWRKRLDAVASAAAPLMWGASGAALALFLLPMFHQQPAAEPGLQLATVDIAAIMQEYHSRVLRDPNNPTAVNWALEDSARAADQIDPLLKYLGHEVHPGYTLVQPQALAYQGDVPDFTDEFRVLLLKRTGKFNKDLAGDAHDNNNALPPAPGQPDATSASGEP